MAQRPLVSKYLRWLAGQLIQIFLQSRFRIQIFYVFPCGVNPVEDNCMMTKASYAVGAMAASWASAGSMMAIVLHCLCCCHHCLVSLLPLSPLAASLLFGVIVTIVAIVAIVAIVTVVAIVAILVIALFDPVTVTLATYIITLAVVVTWFL
jgi:hypothetical protein